MQTRHIFTVIGSALTIGAGIFLLTNLEPAKYSDKWFKSLSKEDLDAERELIQKQWASAGSDYSFGVWLQRMLYRFDDEIRLRDYGVVKPEDYKYPAHREDGWHLYRPNKK